MRLETLRYANRELVIGQDGLTIGRDPMCGVVVESEKISRRHAVIYNEAADCWVKDWAPRTAPG